MMTSQFLFVSADRFKIIKRHLTSKVITATHIGGGTRWWLVRVTLQRYSQSRRTACRRTERGLELVLYGGSPLTFFRSSGNGR